MNGMMPATSMLRTNLQPTRSMVFSNPDKLTYFARANAVRAGTYHTWGAFHGLGESMPDHGVATSDNVKAAGALQTVGDLFGNIGRSLLGATAVQPAVQPAVVMEQPSPVLPIAVGLGAAGLAAFVIYKVMKKR